MKNLLTKEYGPFTGGVWLVIIVGGVGLGLVMRRFMNRDSGEFSAASPGVSADGSGASVDPASPAFLAGGTTFNQGEIVADVIEALKLQTPPPATTDPTVISGGSATVTALEQKLEGLKAQLAELSRQYTALQTAYKATPTSQPNKRKELYAEMEKNQDRRRVLQGQIAAVQAELTFAKAKLVTT